MRIVIVILVLLIAVGAVVFAPVYNGRAVCGITPEGGCWRDKINLIKYVRDYDRIKQDNVWSDD